MVHAPTYQVFGLGVTTSRRHGLTRPGSTPSPTPPWGGGRGDAPRHAGGYAHPEEDVSLQDERESVDTDELIGGSPGAGYYRRMKHEEIRGQRRRAGAVTQARSQAVMQSMLGRRGVGAGGGGKAGGGAAQQQQAGNYRGDVRWPGQ